MKIVMIGLGTVALADALALGRRHDIVLTGPVPDRVDAINSGSYQVSDPCLESYVQDHRLRVRATLDTRTALEGAQMVFVSAPLSLDPDTNTLRTIELESRIELAAEMLPHVPIVIRSAVPIGYTEALRLRLKGVKLVYAPEFSREGSALGDVLNPRFLVIGDRGNVGAKVAQVLLDGALANGFPIRQMGSTEAEALRHLSVLFQAARVAYFNELDSYAMSHGLNARQIIDGVCLDPRIGQYGNNPCFGYSGTNLAHSTINLAKPFEQIDAQIIPNLAHANEARITVLAEYILRRGAQQIGFYQQNTRIPANSPMIQLRNVLEGFGLKTHLHISSDPDELKKFKEKCDIVVAHRVTPDLIDICEKVFTRDHFAAV